MKKFLKRGFVALTLVGALMAAAPQQANAEEFRNNKNTVLHRYEATADINGVTDVIYFRDGGCVVIMEDGTWIHLNYEYHMQY